MMIIERPALVERLQETNKWAFIYGRRKTGKTFLVRTFIDHDAYFFVKRDRTVLEGTNTLTYDAFIQALTRELQAEGTVVVDEFHRFGEDFFDRIHAMEKHGRLILISSTLSLSKKLLGTRSPLLGLFQEIPVPLITLTDTLTALEAHDLPPKERLETAILLREPLAIDYFDPKRTDREAFRMLLRNSMQAIPALAGETLQEEDRSLSRTYEGILRAIATGKTVSGEISDYLFARTLLKKNDPSLIQKHLANLVEFGLLTKLQVYNKNRYVYQHASPLLHLFYHADERYNVSEREATSEEFDRIIDAVLPHIIEGTVRNHLARQHGLEAATIQESDHDVDAALLRFSKPSIIAEIKWKDPVRAQDITRAEETLSRYEADRKLLFVPDKTKVSSDEIEVIDVLDL